jgi:elongation factor G
MVSGSAAGFPVVDVKVTVVDGSHHDVDSNEAAFRAAGAAAFRAAAEQAHRQVLEPILEVKVDTPEASMGDVMGDLTGRRGQITSVEPHGNGVSRIIARVPMAEMRRYAQDLRALTHGRGQAVTEIAGYVEAPAAEAKRLAEQEAERRASLQ